MNTKPSLADLNKLTFAEMVVRFPDEPSAIQYLEAVRWPSGPSCPRCGCVDVSRVETKRKRPLLYCTACKEQFSVTVGTVMEDTKIGLHKWLLAIHLMCSSKKGVSSLQLHRMLGISRRSAWHLSHRIRMGMLPSESMVLDGTVEADETYIGGRTRGRGRGYLGNKVAVVTVVQRDGSAHSHVMPEVNSAAVGSMLRDHVAPTARLNTDESGLYTAPGREFAAHDTVNHKAEEYARTEPTGILVSTNTVEGYFGNFKRQIYGTHHHVSVRLLPRYLGEFEYKYNSRRVKDGVRTVDAVRRTEGRRLTLYRAKTVNAPCLIDRKL